MLKDSIQLTETCHIACYRLISVSVVERHQ